MALEVVGTSVPRVDGAEKVTGARIAAVAAIDEDTAQAALDLIEVEYEELPAVFEIDEAMAPGAPILHPDWNSYPGVTETPGPGPFGGHKPLATPSNVYTHRSR